MDVDPILLPLVTALTDGERKKRDTHRAKRQFNIEEVEASAEEGDLVSHAENDISRVVEEEEEGAQSAVGSADNPENPYQVSLFINSAVYGKQVSRVGEFLIKKLI